MLNRVAFLFLKDVLDLWYAGYFLFIAVGRLWENQEGKTTRQTRNQKAADRFHNHQ